LQQEAVDLNALTAQFLNMVERVIGEDIELSFRPASGLHTVFADKGMMEQVILNLCVNARDAMPGGGILEIETGNFVADAEYCRIHNWENPGDYVVLSVRDNGTGMTPETSDHIFEPFFTTKEVGQGTGLGLAMLHGIVEQHAGKIEVSSEPGEGTTFRIYLPRSEVEFKDSEQVHLSEASGGSESILVVEDEKAVRDLLAQLLESKGYHVLTADDGMQAIEQLESGAESIDLVILDVVMPKMQGTEVYEYIHKNHSGLPVIFSTGYSDSVLDPEFRDSSKIVLIQKPYSPAVLFTTVRKSLDEKH
jgi:CheY-like chemotaxis protein